MDKRKFERETDGSWRVRPTPCPNCGGEMHHGTLRTPGRLDSRVFIEIEEWEHEEGRHLGLDVWVCQVCGYVELHILPSRETLHRP